MALTAESYVRDILYLRRYLTQELQARGFNVQDLETFEVLFPLIISNIDLLNQGNEAILQAIKTGVDSLGYDIDVTTVNTMLNAIGTIIDDLKTSNAQLEADLNTANNNHTEETHRIIGDMSDLAELPEGTEENFDNYYQVIKDNLELIATALMEMYPDDIEDYKINLLTPFILDNQTGWLKIRTQNFTQWNHLFYNYQGDPTFLMKHIENAENCRGMLNGCNFNGSISLLLPYVVDCSQLGGDFNSLELTLHKNSPIYMYRMMAGAKLKELSLIDAIPSNVEGMFFNAAQIQNIVFQNVSLSEVHTFSNMFNGCVNLTKIDLPEGFMNNPNVADTTCMFQSCMKLETIPDFDFTSVTQTSLMFYSCAELKNIRFKEGSLNTPLTLTSAKKLTRESLESVINSLKDRTGEETYVLSLGTDNLNKLADIDLAIIASTKNWTIS